MMQSFQVRIAGIVEAFAASWIEITRCISICAGNRVEAFAASWIEIVIPGNCKYALLGRSLCGFVD